MKSVQMSCTGEHLIHLPAQCWLHQPALMVPVQQKPCLNPLCLSSCLEHCTVVQLPLGRKQGELKWNGMEFCLLAMQKAALNCSLLSQPVTAVFMWGFRV